MATVADVTSSFNTGSGITGAAGSISILIIACVFLVVVMTITYIMLDDSKTGGEGFIDIFPKLFKALIYISLILIFFGAFIK